MPEITRRASSSIFTIWGPCLEYVCIGRFRHDVFFSPAHNLIKFMQRCIDAAGGHRYNPELLDVSEKPVPIGLCPCRVATS